MKIVGIAGLPRSGKDSLAELFMEAGYFGESLGDIVREFTRERHKDKPDPISRANTTETSNWLRETRGADVILQEALKRYEAASKEKDYKGVVLYSVRAPVEVDFILERGGDLIWVEASDEVRHQRHLDHLREGELPTSLHEFLDHEAEQWQPQPGIPKDAQMDISYVKSKATMTLLNNGNNITEFKKDAEKVLGLSV
jgi:dephospho-CoA kinase